MGTVCSVTVVTIAISSFKALLVYLLQEALLDFLLSLSFSLFPLRHTSDYKFPSHPHQLAHWPHQLPGLTTEVLRPDVTGSLSSLHVFPVWRQADISLIMFSGSVAIFTSDSPLAHADELTSHMKANTAVARKSWDGQRRGRWHYEWAASCHVCGLLRSQAFLEGGVLPFHL